MRPCPAAADHGVGGALGTAGRVAVAVTAKVALCCVDRLVQLPGLGAQFGAKPGTLAMAESSPEDRFWSEIWGGPKFPGGTHPSCPPLDERVRNTKLLRCLNDVQKVELLNVGS